MANEAVLMTADQQAALIEQVVVHGDLDKLTPAQRVQYYWAVCQSLGLNPLTKPFDYLRLNGRLVLYATRTCTDQLRANHRISIAIVSREVIEDVYVVTARGTTPEGRTDEATGAVAIAGLKGEARANAFMKAETKAKRRLTLSMVGLGWLDESEVSSSPDATPVRVDAETGEILDTPATRPEPPGNRARPKAQHPLQAAGIPTELIVALTRWLGDGKPPAQWEAARRAEAQALTAAIRAAREAGIPARDVAGLLETYVALPPTAANRAACLAQLQGLAAEPDPVAEAPNGTPVA